MPMNKTNYPDDWKAISKRIRERDGNRCKTCGVANGIWICRDLEGKNFMVEDGHVFHDDTGAPAGIARGSEYDGTKMVKTVLTVAHLDHDSRNNADENLAALCQLHHLRLDAKQHAESTRKTRRERLAVGELFSEVEEKP